MEIDNLWQNSKTIPEYIPAFPIVNVNLLFKSILPHYFNTMLKNDTITKRKLTTSVCCSTFHDAGHEDGSGVLVTPNGGSLEIKK